LFTHREHTVQHRHAPAGGTAVLTSLLTTPAAASNSDRCRHPNNTTTCAVATCRAWCSHSQNETRGNNNRFRIISMAGRYA
jgi:hypothetical protein